MMNGAAETVAVHPDHLLQDLDAEAAVCSAVILDPSALPKVPWLRPEDFYSEAHRRIYEAALDLRAKGSPVDAVLVATRLKDTERLAQVGGMAYLTEVLNAAPAVTNVSAYAATVALKARTRRHIGGCEAAAAQMRSGIDPDAVMAALARTAEPAASGLHVMGPEEVWAPIPAPDYAIGSLTRGDVAMMVAHGSSLKSWAGIAAVVCKAAGVRWLERFDCTPSPALYLDNEMGPDECRRRMQRCAAAHGQRGPVQGVGLVSMPGIVLTRPDGIAALRELATGRALVVVDSLSAFCPDVDENDARFADPLKRMKEIGQATACAFLVLHHSRKAREGDDERERPRGTSALFAACDAVMQFSRAGDGFLVRQTKSRRGKSSDDFVLHVQDVEGVDATRVYAGEIEETDVAEAADSLERAKRAIIVLLGREHDVRSANEIVRRTKGARLGRAALLDALKELKERGTVVVHDGALRLASEVTK